MASPNKWNLRSWDQAWAKCSKRNRNRILIIPLTWLLSRKLKAKTLSSRSKKQRSSKQNESLEMLTKTEQIRRILVSRTSSLAGHPTKLLQPEHPMTRISQPVLGLKTRTCSSASLTLSQNLVTTTLHANRALQAATSTPIASSPSTSTLTPIKLATTFPIALPSPRPLSPWAEAIPHLSPPALQSSLAAATHKCNTSSHLLPSSAQIWLHTYQWSRSPFAYWKLN